MTALDARTVGTRTPEQTESASVDSVAPGGGRRLWSVVASLALTVLLVALLGLAAAVMIVPRAIGAVPLTVLSGSMEPTFSPGDLVIARPVDPQEIRVGDVVTFQPETDNPTLVTHRVIGIQMGGEGVSGFVTRGDANGAEDDPIVPDQVMGRVMYSVPLLGHITQGSWGPTVATIGGIGALVYAVLMIATPDRSQRMEPNHEETS